MKPLISIITPTYNHEPFIGECIESVLAQTFPSWEMIIVDDASIDRTPMIIADYARKDARIKFIRHETKWGIYRLADIYNEALNISEGKLIAILEGDDFWPKDKLKKQLKAFENPHILLSWGKVAMVDEKGESLGIIPTRRIKKDVAFNNPVGNILKILLFKDIIPAVSVIVRKDELLSIGGFVKRDYLPLVDYPTWLLLSLKGQFYFEEEIVGYWRRHEDQATAFFKENQELASIRFVSEFYEMIPNQLKEKLGFRHEKIFKRQKYRLSYPYFSFGRVALGRRQWKEARKNFQVAFKKGSLRTKMLSLLGILLSYFKIGFKK